jgi:hypothetical protein
MLEIKKEKKKKVPTFPIQSRSNLFKVVIDTLINNKPPFWLDYFNYLMKRDVILQEAHQSTEQKRVSPESASTSKHFMPTV